MTTSGTRRSRPDLCPGVLRPWPAVDGALVRLRIPGGHLAPTSLAALGRVAARHGDGNVHTTSRANLQLRGLPAHGGCLDGSIVEEIEATGLLPSRSHELVRNVLASPLTGLVGGRADLRGLGRELDAGISADPALAGLSARFLFVLDDGRGDVIDHPGDLALVALDDATAQLRVGESWAEVIALDDAVAHLLRLARGFVAGRGTGPGVPWHVRELTRPLADTRPRDPRVPAGDGPLAYGVVPGTRGPVEHVAAPNGVVDPELLERLTGTGVAHLIVTPWRGIVAVGA